MHSCPLIEIVVEHSRQPLEYKEGLQPICPYKVVGIFPAEVHDPDVERYAQTKICCWQDDGPFKFVKQKINQASLEDEGIEEHEEDDDDIKENGNILNNEENKLNDRGHA